MNAAIEVRDAVMQELWRASVEELGPIARAVAEAVLAGRDVIGVLPEGRERELSYQLPALFLPRLTVIVTPRPEESENVVPYLDREDIPARVYVTPGRVQTDDCVAMLRLNGVSRVVVDGAYAGVSAALWRLGRPPVLAFATSADAISDLTTRLGLRRPAIFLPTEPKGRR